MSSTRPALLTNLRPVENFLDSAHRYGVPLPFDVTVTPYEVRFIVHADELPEWVEYLEVAPDSVVESTNDHGTHRRVTTTIVYTDVPLVVSTWIAAPAGVSA